jgi:hypothetical protein
MLQISCTVKQSGFTSTNTIKESVIKSRKRFKTKSYYK